MSDFDPKTYEGNSNFRLNDDNPREVSFARAWHYANARYTHTLEYLLGKPNEQAVVSDRDRMVAATVIQWLGSNVGMSFLEDVIQSCPEISTWIEVKNK